MTIKIFMSIEQDYKNKEVKLTNETKTYIIPNLKNDEYEELPELKELLKEMFKGEKEETLVITWDIDLKMYLQALIKEWGNNNIRVFNISTLIELLTGINRWEEIKKSLGIRNMNTALELKYLYFHLYETTLTLKYLIDPKTLTGLLKGDGFNHLFNQPVMESNDLGKLYRYSIRVVKARNEAKSTFTHDNGIRNVIVEMYNGSYEKEEFEGSKLYEEHISRRYS